MTIELTPEELASPTWKKLRAHMEASLQEARMRNDHDGPDFSTYKLRGEISSYKQLLRLDPDWQE